MGLEEITNTIIAEAEKEAEKIRQDSEKKRHAIEEKGKEKASKAELDIKQKIESEGEKVIERAKLESNIEERNQLVEAKQKLVNKAFNQAKKNITQLDQSKHTEILTTLINGLPEVQDGKIIAAKGTIEQIRGALEKSGRNFKIADEEFDAIGGFIFKSPEIEVNNSYDELLKGLREDLEIEISQKLFG